MYEFLKYVVSDVMSRDVVVAAPSTSLGELEAIFAERDFNGLPVISKSRELVGMVTKLDILKAFRFTEEHLIPRYDEIVQRRASSVMSEIDHPFAPEAPLTRVLEYFVATRFKSCPVLDHGRLVGIVSREDVLNALRASAAGRVPTK
jgi:CBS-domain-containing membrane protein